MASTLLSPLWQRAWEDLQHPAVLWQVVTIGACLGLAWLLARLLCPQLSASERRLRLHNMGVGNMERALWPLLALLLIWLAQQLLAHWYPVNLLRLASALIAAFAAIRMALHILRRVFVRGGRAGTTVLLVERAITTLVWSIVALHIAGLLPEMLALLEQFKIPIGKSRVSVLAILQAAVFITITLVGALWLGATLETRLMAVDDMNASLRVVLVRLGKSVLVLVAVLLSLSLVGIDLTVLSVFGGALGVGLGLGMQKIVSNYVSGFIILLERSIGIGDVVTVDKYAGTVKRINTRYTTLRNGDGAEAIIPNEMLLAQAVLNQYPGDRRVRQVTRVKVAYGAEITHLQQVLAEAVAAVPRVLARPAPTVLLSALQEGGMTLEVGFWIADPENGKANVLSDVNISLLRTLNAHGVAIP